MNTQRTEGGLARALGHGWAGRCPRCGEGAVFRRFLKLSEVCEVCRYPLGEIRADDFPPYLTMVLVGHIVVPLILIAERVYAPPIWQHLIVGLPLAVLLTYLAMPRVKGAVVGLMMHLGLKGDERQ